MDHQHIYNSLGTELLCLKDRVRQLIGDAHWQTDGEWKESVLRNVIRRYLPAQILMRRGFMVDKTPIAHYSSGQIDILFTDSRWPTLFSDGELAIVAVSSVRGIVEVKTQISTRTVQKELEKLVRDSSGVLFPATGRICALFAFGHKMGKSAHHTLLDKLHATADGDPMKVVNTVVAGPNLIIRYVESENEWRAYQVEGEAFGYFIAIALRSLIFTGESCSDDFQWFPYELPCERCIATKLLV
jgi:hypothetical protein